MKDAVRNWVDDNCSLPLSALEKKLEEEFDVVVSESTVDRCLRAFHYSVN